MINCDRRSALERPPTAPPPPVIGGRAAPGAAAPPRHLRRAPVLRRGLHPLRRRRIPQGRLAHGPPPPVQEGRRRPATPT